MRFASTYVGLHLGLAVVALAGPPQIDNADLQSVALQGELETRVETWSETAGEASWLGWHVPMVERNQVLCCWSRGDRGRPDQACALEGSHRHFVFSSEESSPVPGGENLVILLRSIGGRLDEIQVYSDGCRLDAGGRRVTWLEGVEPEESVDLFGRLTQTRSDLQDEALMALALHATPLAGERLAAIARRDPNADLRGEALFWLAHRGAPSAAGIILEALGEDQSSKVQEEAVFALSQLPDNQGMNRLLEILQDPAWPSEVREQAFFWYVQSGDDQALDLIAEILTN